MLVSKAFDVWYRAHVYTNFGERDASADFRSFNPMDLGINGKMAPVLADYGDKLLQSGIVLEINRANAILAKQVKKLVDASNGLLAMQEVGEFGRVWHKIRIEVHKDFDVFMRKMEERGVPYQLWQTVPMSRYMVLKGAFANTPVPVAKKLLSSSFCLLNEQFRADQLTKEETGLLIETMACIVDEVNKRR